MVEAVMFWNEPNNKSHWEFEIDPEWRLFAQMVKLAAAAVRAENPRLRRVLGGISPIDHEAAQHTKSGVFQACLRWLRGFGGHLVPGSCGALE